MKFQIKYFCITFILCIVCWTSCSYLPESGNYDEDLVINETVDYIEISSGSPTPTKSGIMFYPGGLVDPHAYIEVLKTLAKEDRRTIVIVKVSSNLAILNSGKASSILEEFPHVERWVLGGHSLGGSVACMDIKKNPDNFQGLFLLASYAVDDISNLPIPMISITASEDTVLDLDKFEENKKNLATPKIIEVLGEIENESSIGVTYYHEILGGNHAQFGHYGEQKGDGTATISSEAQQAQLVDFVHRFLQSNQL